MLSDENLRAWLRFFFSQTEEAPALPLSAVDDWISWLSFHQLDPYAWERLQGSRQLNTLPSQAVSSLRRLVFSHAAVAATRQHALPPVLRACQQAEIEVVLLKGAVLTFGRAYANPVWRVMGDFDLWVQPAQMPAAVGIMQSLGYHVRHDVQRPHALRVAEQTEIEMSQAGTSGQAVDIHYRPFLGGWLSAVMPADVDEGLWQRREVISEGGVTTYRLAPEDNLIHLAVHIAVNHQMGAPGLRAFWDVATSLRAWPVDWDVVVERTQHWRVQTALYLVLRLAAEWVAAPVPAEVISTLRPSRQHLAILQRITPPETILRGTKLSSSHRRYLFLLALLDRPRDGLLLVRQALLPNREWLRLRYDGDADDLPQSRLYLRYLWQALRSPRF